MKYFEVILNGFDPEVSDTDHLIKWVKAEDISSLKERLNALKLTDYIRNINELSRVVGYYDGLDIDENNIQENGEPLNPVSWIKESNCVLDKRNPNDSVY